jgi:Na+-translocating ferredoxin:NAD+ oxidoreductase subunit E
MSGKNSNWTVFMRGLVKENPVFVMLLGMCPTLGVTTSALNGLGMGVATLFVLILSNVAISLIKTLIPDQVRIPAYIVVIASFVTMVDLLMAAYWQPMHEKLGLFIPLIVVNCIILGRAEAFASKNSTMQSLIDGLSMGIGFTWALALLGGTRELLGSGAIFDFPLVGEDASTMLLFIMPPGAFLALGYLALIINRLRGVK